MSAMATIGVFTGPEGHYSLGEAATEALAANHTVVEFFREDPLFLLYRPFYQLFPVMQRIPYHLSQMDGTQKLMHEVFRDRYHKLLESFFNENKPDICISTYFMYNPSLEDIQEKTGTPFLNIAPDPRSIHPMFVSRKAALNFVYDEQAVTTCASFSDEIKAVASGWFVRDRFSPVTSKQAIRKKLHLDPDTLTLLVTSGSDGTSMILKIIPALFSAKQPVQVVVACGNNKTLFSGITTLQKILEKTNPSSALVALGFVTNLNEYMQAADLVVGKAGPNSLFEAVATHTPYFAVTHIPGQEDGNLDIIREEKLGFVEENPIKASQLLLDCIAHPESLAEFLPHLQKTATHIATAKTMLRSTVDGLLTTNLN